MTSSLRIADRLLTLLLAGVLLGGALWMIGYAAKFAPARRGAAHLQPNAIVTLVGQPWWPAALVAGGIAVVLVGLWLVLLHLRPTTVKNIRVQQGQIDLNRLARTAAEDLARHPSVQYTKAATGMHRHRPIVRITVGLPANTSPAQTTELAHQFRRDLHRAAGTDIEVHMLIDAVPEHKTRPPVT